MKKLLIVLFMSLGATCAWSQSAFKGFYGQISAGYGTSSPDSDGGSGAAVIGGTSYPFTFVTEHDTHRDFMGTAAVGYTFSISKKFLLGVGAEFTKNSGDWTTITTTNNYNVQTTDEYKIANSFDFFLSPSYAIGEDKLVSAKVGYAVSQTENDITGTESSNHETSGYILGLGYKQIIKGSLYGLAEFDYNRTSDQTYENSGVSVNGYPFASTLDISSHSYRFQVGIGFIIK